MSVTIYHNPRCSNSRTALGLIREEGIEPVVVEYLKTGWDAAQLRALFQKAGLSARQVLRDKEPLAAELKSAGDDAIIAAMVANPILVNRPIVETDTAAALCRPPEKVKDLIG